MVMTEKMIMMTTMMVTKMMMIMNMMTLIEMMVISKMMMVMTTCEKSVCMGAPMMTSSSPSPLMSFTATEWPK